MTTVTAGLKCAPESGPRIVISTIRIRTRRYRVAKERNGLVAAGKALRHDPGADHGAYQQAGAERFGTDTLAEGHYWLPPDLPSMRPISLSRVCRASLSSDRIGKLMSAALRLRR
jgi:hypothetical protein